MTDAKRKLPVLYLIPDALDDDPQDVTLCVERSVAVALAGARCCVVEYEPSVPRCRTCSFYESRPGYESVCNEQCPGYEDRREVPNDGSGFCHAHQPKETT